MEDNFKTQKFSFYYDATEDELNNHQMDAFDLGTSILQTSKLLTHADNLLNDNKKTLKLNVAAPIREGSVAIDFIVTFLDSGGMDVLKTIGIYGAPSAIVGGSLFEVMKQVKGEKIISINTSDDSDTAEIQMENKVVKCNRKVAKLVSDHDIRASVNEIISKPLLSKNNPSFKIEVEGSETINLQSEQISDFARLPKDSLLMNNEEHVTADVNITQVNFTSSKGWKMLYENNEVAVTMQDESFMEKLNHDAQSFRKGDMLTVDLLINKVIDQMNNSSPKTKYTITNVRRHRASSERKLI